MPETVDGPVYLCFRVGTARWDERLAHKDTHYRRFSDLNLANIDTLCVCLPFGEPVTALRTVAVPAIVRGGLWAALQ